MTSSTENLIPALRYDALTRFYDPLMGALLRERAFKSRLVQQAAPRPGHRVLDLGCGTGTLTLMLKGACPEAHVVGLDADEKVLARARAKAEQSGLAIELYHGSATRPPFPDRSFDRVVSSLLLHHLSTRDKQLALERARGLLRPSGELHLADWGEGQNPLMRVAFLGVRVLDGFATTRDNAKGRLLPLIQGAGFSHVTRTHQQATPLGTLDFYRAVA